MLSTQVELKKNGNGNGNGNGNWFTQEEFFNRKKINPTIFQNVSTSFQSPLTEHSGFAFENFYALPYLMEPAEEDQIVRFHHGIAHANRVANYIPIFANLFKKYDNLASLQLRDDDLKLLQLTALFHDTARESDGTDEWDEDSGILLYLYLKAIGIDEKKAIILAEAIANKDRDETSKYYKELHINSDGKMAWFAAPPREKNIYQILLHDSDCLDIIRARNHFKGKKLDFFKKIAQKNDGAFKEMAHLITKARSIIETQGDSRQVPKKNIKILYEQKDSYIRSLETFQQPVLETTNITRAMEEGKVFARGMVIVSGQSAKKITTEDGAELDETLVALELRKAARRLGAPTTSSKPNKDGSKPNIEKQGNLNRSICMLGYGAAAFSDAGFLLINPDKKLIKSISVKDSDTGFGKKKISMTHFKLLVDIEKELNTLHTSLMAGGSSRVFKDVITATHNEITYDIDHFDAIYFTQDPNFANLIYSGKATQFHRYTPILSACYLQDEYKNFHGKILPIFEYSGLHNSIREIKPEEYSEKFILEMWSIMIRDYLYNLESFDAQVKLLNKNKIDKLKILSMYGAESFEKTAYHVKSILPADRYYSIELQQAINQAAEAIIDEIYNNYPEVGKLIVEDLTRKDLKTWKVIENYLRELKDDKEIDKIIDNKLLLTYLIENNPIFHTFNILDSYWERHQTAEVKGFVNYNELLHSKKELLNAINAGKLSGYRQDKNKRYQRNQYPKSRIMRYNNDYVGDFTGCDFSKFNFDGFTFKKFKLQSTRWHFVKSDEVIFNKCYLDDLFITKNSDLSGVFIEEPIFSSNIIAKKLADLFDTIPTFILQNQYINEVKSLIKDKKKIHFDEYDHMFHRLRKMIINNEFELFDLAIKSLENNYDYSEQCKELLINVIDTQKINYTRCDLNHFFRKFKTHKAAANRSNNISTLFVSNENRFCFAEAIIRHHVFEFTAQDYEDNFMITAIRVKNYSAIALLLTNHVLPHDIIQNQAVFDILYGLLNVLPDIFPKESENQIKINLSKAHLDRRYSFYAIAERLIYICAYLKNAANQPHNRQMAISLIKQLEMTYYAQLDNRNINNKLIYLLNILDKNNILIQKALQVDDRALNRFSAYIYKNKEIEFSNENLSQVDIIDLCDYLLRNPQIVKVYIGNNRLTSKDIALLVSVPTLRKLLFDCCQLNAKAINILTETSHLTALLIYEHNVVDGITINKIKKLASNLAFTNLEYKIDNQTKEERQVWKKILREKDPIIRANFAVEVKMEVEEKFTLIRKIT
jgi:hypothetical protein